MFYYLNIINYFENNCIELSVYLIISFLLAFVLFCVPVFFALSNYTSEKGSAYECGFEPFSEAHNLFDIHFVIVAILFLLFDFELLLLFPFVVGYSLGIQIYNSFFLINIFGFVFLLIAAFIYEWLSGALVWPIFVNK